MSRRFPSGLDPQAKLLVLLERAKGARRRADYRRSYLLFREAAYFSDDSPKLWTLYGACCFEVGKCEEGEKVLLQAAWFWSHQGSPKKARATARYLARHGCGLGVRKSAA